MVGASHKKESDDAEMSYKLSGISKSYNSTVITKTQSYTPYLSTIIMKIRKLFPVPANEPQLTCLLDIHHVLPCVLTLDLAPSTTIKELRTIIYDRLFTTLLPWDTGDLDRSELNAPNVLHVDFEALFEGVGRRVIPMKESLDDTLSKKGIKDGARLYRKRPFTTAKIGRFDDGGVFDPADLRRHATIGALEDDGVKAGVDTAWQDEYTGEVEEKAADTGARDDKVRNPLRAQAPVQKPGVGMQHTTALASGPNPCHSTGQSMGSAAVPSQGYGTGQATGPAMVPRPGFGTGRMGRAMVLWHGYGTGRAMGQAIVPWQGFGRGQAMGRGQGHGRRQAVVPWHGYGTGRAMGQALVPWQGFGRAQAVGRGQGRGRGQSIGQGQTGGRGRTVLG